MTITSACPTILNELVATRMAKRITIPSPISMVPPRGNTDDSTARAPVLQRLARAEETNRRRTRRHGGGSTTEVRAVASVLSISEARASEKVLLSPGAAEQLERLLELHVVVEAHSLGGRVTECEMRDATLKLTIDRRRCTVIQLSLDRYAGGG